MEYIGRESDERWEIRVIVREADMKAKDGRGIGAYKETPLALGNKQKIAKQKFNLPLLTNNTPLQKVGSPGLLMLT